MLLKNKTLGIILLLLSAGMNVSGQFSVDEYLSAPFTEGEIKGLQQQLEYMNENSFSSPLFREIEVRLRSNNNNLSPEDFRFRIGFMNPLEQKANRKYNESHEEYLQKQYEFEINLVLANRYKQIAKHYFLSKQKEVITQEIEVLQTNYTNISKDKWDFGLWLETDEKILKRDIELNKVKTDQNYLEYNISQSVEMKEQNTWDDFLLVNVQSMEKIVLADTSGVFKELEIKLMALELENKAYKLEKAESFSNIGFFQTEYDIDRGKDVNDHLGFQLGLSLPVFNPDKPKLQRNKLEIIEEENQVLETQKELNDTRFKILNEFTGLARLYYRVDEKLSNLNQIDKALNVSDLEEIIRFTFYKAELQQILNEIYYSCLINYIDILALTGKLSEPPYINYLSSQLRPVTEE